MMDNLLIVIQIATGIGMGLGMYILTSLSSRIRQMERWKVDKGHLKTQMEVIDERFRGIDLRIKDARDFNNQDHSRLEKRVMAMQSAVDEIKDCLSKMARQKEC
jgi:hypothetical protein